MDPDVGAGRRRLGSPKIPGFDQGDFCHFFPSLLVFSPACGVVPTVASLDDAPVGTPGRRLKIRRNPVRKFPAIA
jgi:hypothetical protein